MAPAHTYVTDLGHFLDAGGSLVEGTAAKMALYLALIVEQGSVMEIGEGRSTAMPCARPSRRKRCGGLLSVGRSAEDSIEWECPHCGENGVIRGWESTQFNIGPSTPMEFTGDTIDAVVLVDELWAIRRRPLALLPAMRGLLVEAIDLGGGYVSFRADQDALEELAYTAQAAADDARRDDRRLLDRFTGRVDALRATLPRFSVPTPANPDLMAAAESDLPFEDIAVNREVAAYDEGDDGTFDEATFDEVAFDEAVEADDARRKGKLRVLH